MSAKRRFRITGKLVTAGPLHIGSGVDEPEERMKDEEGRAVVVARIVRDVEGKPYIPGSALRGCLRAWMEQAGADGEIVRSLWGSGEKEKERGGRLYVRDGFFNPELSEAPDLPPRRKKALFETRHWDPGRWTWLENGVAIDRFTRTAAHHKLFYYEAAPARTVFDVTLDGVGLTDDELAWLLAGLSAFNHPWTGLRLGASVGAGYGACEWRKEHMRVTGLLTREDRLAWIDGKKKHVGFDGFPRVGSDYLESLDAPAMAPAPDAFLTMEIEIHFSSPMLVNDPSRCGKKEPDAPEIPDHAFLTDHLGRVLLPGRSVRGALRSQAERIVRTMAEARCNGARPDPELLKPLSCYPHESDLACEPIHDKKETERLCITCRLFGCGGWRSPLWISHFEALDPGRELSQEFVAIDRFTGGAADKKKFNALSRMNPVFKGVLSVDLDRIHEAHLGLLCLLTRDLIEGDVQFGYGRAKGYGVCTARISRIRLPGRWPEEMARFDDVFASPPGEAPLEYTPEIRSALADLVKALERRIGDEFGR